jgi:hypothetical protein
MLRPTDNGCTPRSRSRATKATQQVLEAAAEYLIQGTSGPLRACRLHEYESRGGNEPVLGRGFRCGPILDSGQRIQPAENGIQVALPGRQGFQKPDHLFYGLNGGRVCVFRRKADTDSDPSRTLIPI